jgi:hypothetical protein
MRLPVIAYRRGKANKQASASASAENRMIKHPKIGGLPVGLSASNSPNNATASLINEGITTSNQQP